MLALIAGCVFDPVFNVKVVNPCVEQVVVELWTGFPQALEPDQLGVEPYKLDIEPLNTGVWVTAAGVTVVLRVDSAGYRRVLTSVRGEGSTLIVDLPPSVCP